MSVMDDCLLQHPSYRSKTNLLTKEHLLCYKSLTWSVFNRNSAKWCICPLCDANSWGFLVQSCCISSRQTKAHLCSCKDCNLLQSSVEQWADLGCVAATWFVLGKIHTSFAGSYIVSRTIAVLCVHIEIMQDHSLLRLNSINYSAWVRGKNWLSEVENGKRRKLNLFAATFFKSIC